MNNESSYSGHEHEVPLDQELQDAMEEGRVMNVCNNPAVALKTTVMQSSAATSLQNSTLSQIQSLLQQEVSSAATEHAAENNHMHISVSGNFVLTTAEDLLREQQKNLEQAKRHQNMFPKSNKVMRGFGDLR